jgi:hypothetical protein
MLAPSFGSSSTWPVDPFAFEPVVRQYIMEWTLGRTKASYSCLRTRETKDPTVFWAGIRRSFTRHNLLKVPLSPNRTMDWGPAF